MKGVNTTAYRVYRAITEVSKQVYLYVDVFKVLIPATGVDH
jgi:hypothetical protein